MFMNTYVPAAAKAVDKVPQSKTEQDAGLPLCTEGLNPVSSS
jgi:hypothetical protein